MQNANCASWTIALDYQQSKLSIQHRSKPVKQMHTLLNPSALSPDLRLCLAHDLDKSLIRSKLEHDSFGPCGPEGVRLGVNPHSLACPVGECRPRRRTTKLFYNLRLCHAWAKRVDTSLIIIRSDRGAGAGETCHCDRKSFHIAPSYC